MLRNDLITLLGQKDNDPVVVEVKGTFLDVTAVTGRNGYLVIVLNDDKQPDADDNDT